jgi:PKD repeat protein
MKTKILLITLTIGVFITFSRSNAQQTLLTPTVQIDKTANKLCFGKPYQVTCSYTNADGVFWWRSPQSDGTIIGNVNGTSIIYNPGIGDMSKLYFWIYVRTTHSDTTKPAVDSIRVMMSAMPVPQFGAFPKEGCAPLTVDFRDSTKISTGSIATWEWDFGDGQKSTSQNPQHIYSQPGAYAVKLKAVSDAGCDRTIIEDNYIFARMVPEARFFTQLIAPRTVEFQNSTKYAGVLTQYLWNFGDYIYSPPDGGYSTEKDPSYKYTVTGKYTVWMWAKNEYGCSDSVYKTFTVTNTSLLGLPYYLDNIKTIIYPNPVKDKLMVMNCQDEAVFSLLDINSKTIMKIDSGHRKSLNIDRSALKPGIYILKVEHRNGEKENFKLIFE